MTTNGKLNDTHGYHIKPTNSMWNMISCFHLKGPFCQRSNFYYCRKVLSMKNIWINIKTIFFTQNSVALEVYFSKYRDYIVVYLF